MQLYSFSEVSLSIKFLILRKAGYLYMNFTTEDKVRLLIVTPSQNSIDFKSGTVVALGEGPGGPVPRVNCNARTTCTNSSGGKPDLD